MKQISVNKQGEKIKKWVRVGKDGQKLKSVNKLQGKKLWGYNHADFKKWGEQGGRPQKWASEAERKRHYRQQQALNQGRKLRTYRKHPKL